MYEIFVPFAGLWLLQLTSHGLYGDLLVVILTREFSEASGILRNSFGIVLTANLGGANYAKFDVKLHFPIEYHNHIDLKKF